MGSKNGKPLTRDEILWGENHDAFTGPVFEALVRNFYLGISDQVCDDLLRSQLWRVRDQLARGLHPPFRKPRLGSGEIALGIGSHNTTPKVPVQYQNAHWFTLGGSGSGKTSRAKYMATRLAPFVEGCWLFDFEKREFASLKDRFFRLGKKLHIVPARELRHNPFQVPAYVDPLAHIPRATRVVANAANLAPRGAKLFSKTTFKRFEKNGVLRGSEHYPTLKEIYNDIEADRTANHQAKSGVLDSLEPILRSIGQVLSYRKGWTPQDLAKLCIAFQFGGLTDEDKALLLNSIILQLFSSRIAQGISNPAMDLWICCDEAERLISSSHGRSSGFLEILGLVRGTGIGLDLSGLTSTVPNAVLSNTASKCLMRCGSAKDYDIVGAAMGLTREQRRWLSLHLQPGQAAVQVGEGEHRLPFLIRFPIPEPSVLHETNISDADVLARELSSELAERPPTVNVHTRKSNGPSDAAATPEAGPAREELPTSPRSRLRKASLDYLASVATDPFMNATARDRHLELTGFMGNQVRSEIIREGLAKPVRIEPGGRGKGFQLLELTRSGRRLLKGLRVTVATGFGIGGLGHCWWAKAVTDWAHSQGYVATVEDDSRGVRVDVTIEAPNGPIAVEIETSPGHELANVRKDLSAGFPCVVVLVKSPARTSTIRDGLSEFEFDQSLVHIAVLSKYKEVLARVLRSDSAEDYPLNRNRTETEPKTRAAARQDGAEEDHGSS